MVDLERRPVGVVQAINKLGPDGARDFADGDRAMLQLLADQAGVAIQRFHLQRSAIESMALRKELDLAKRVQEAMIPKTQPDIPGLDAAGWTKAASVNGAIASIYGKCRTAGWEFWSPMPRVTASHRHWSSCKRERSCGRFRKRSLIPFDCWCASTRASRKTWWLGGLSRFSWGFYPPTASSNGAAAGTGRSYSLVSHRADPNARTRPAADRDSS